MAKDLTVTTDFVDDLLGAGRHFEKRDLDAMMKYSASLGATRHEWIFDTKWTVYDEDAPTDYDLLAEACEAAHRHGMRFYTIFKPFEGGTSSTGSLLPHTFRRPAGAPILDEPVGLMHIIRPFVAKHPEMRQARVPGADVDPGGRIAALRLVRNSDAPSPFKPGDLTILTSPRNGGYTRYDGPVEMSDSLEWRRRYPHNDSRVRIVTLGGLDLPADTRCVLIQCRAGRGAEFTNAIENIVELVNENGDLIPSMPSRTRVNLEQYFKRVEAVAKLDLSRYLRIPEARERALDREQFLADCEGVFSFHSWWEDMDLCKVGEFALSRGKPRHIYGAMHPIYPEVRQDWLKDIQYCVDRGVDGVSIRLANHNRPYEPWAYGFNEPVLEKMEHPGHYGEARRINGDAFTQFVREASDLLRGQGKEAGVYVHGLMFHHHDGAANATPLQQNIEWQWETWIRECADYVEFRGSDMLMRHNAQDAIERVGLVTREVGIPFIFQSTRSTKIVHYGGPHPTLASEMDWLRKHPDITTYNLYETAYFSRFNEKDEWEGCPDLAETTKRHWFGKG